jgi:hypothetical protein
MRTQPVGGVWVLPEPPWCARSGEVADLTLSTSVAQHGLLNVVQRLVTYALASAALQEDASSRDAWLSAAAALTRCADSLPVSVG